MEIFLDYETDRHRGNSHVKMEAEVGITQPQAKERLEPAEAGRSKDRILSYSLEIEQDAADTLFSNLCPPEQ